MSNVFHSRHIETRVIDASGGEQKNVTEKSVHIVLALAERDAQV